MAQDSKKQQLVEFLDRKAFDPVLHASEDRYGKPRDKEMLRDVKRATEDEKRRYHEQYDSAADVRRNFKNDLSSEPARRINSELEQLDLPTLPSVNDEFDELCERLGVS